MIADAVLFPDNAVDGRRGRKLGEKLLRPGNVPGHPFLYRSRYKVDGKTYVMMTPFVFGARNAVRARASMDAYDWYQDGDFYIGELKNGDERKA